MAHFAYTSLLLIGLNHVFTIHVPGVSENKGILYTSGIRTSRWEDVHVHHNYSKVYVHPQITQGDNTVDDVEELDILGHRTIYDDNEEELITPTYPGFSFRKPKQKIQDFDSIHKRENTMNDYRNQQKTIEQVNEKPATVKYFYPLQKPIYVHGFKYPPEPDKPLQVYQKCPKMATGQFVYASACNQFLNCWKGRGYPQTCSPGTLFNPKTLECDFAEKVQCVSGPKNYHASTNHQGNKTGCPNEYTGIVPHHYDCAKFMKCTNGIEEVIDCPTDTIFSVRTNLCEYPQNAECAQSSTISGGVQLTPPESNSEDMYSVYTSHEEHQSSNKYPVYVHNPTGGHGSTLDHTQSGTGIVQGYNTQVRPGYVGQQGTVTGYSGPSSPNNKARPEIRDKQEETYGTNIQGYGTHGQAGQQETVTGYGYSGPASQNKNNSWSDSQEHTNGNQVDTDSNTKDQTKCPPGGSGLYPHPVDCSKFLNCANGMTYIQDCAPGTLFNAQSNLCDYPHNVDCTYGRFINEYVRSTPVDQPECPKDFTGLYPHPTICTKFLNCANGQMFIQDCGPGTAFNAVTQVCDWPYKVNCTLGRRRTEQIHTTLKPTSWYHTSPASTVPLTNEQNQGGYNYGQLYVGNQLSTNRESAGRDHKYQPEPQTPTGIVLGRPGHGGQQEILNEYPGQTGQNNNKVHPEIGDNHRGTYGTNTPGYNTYGRPGQQETVDIHGYPGPTHPETQDNEEHTYGTNGNQGDTGPSSQNHLKCPPGGLGSNPHPVDCPQFLGPGYNTHGRPGQQDTSGILVYPGQTGQNNIRVRPEIPDKQDETSGTNGQGYNTHRQPGQQDTSGIPGYSGQTGQNNHKVRPEIPDKQEDTYGINGQGYNTHRQPGQQNTSGILGYSGQTGHIPRQYPVIDQEIASSVNIPDGQDVYPNTYELHSKSQVGCNQFLCKDRTCIPKNKVCNGIQDCKDGLDEQGCDYFLEQFTIKSNSILAVREKIKHLNVSTIACAKACLESTSFVCKSFSYRFKDGACILSDLNVALTGSLISSYYFSYYEVKVHTINCSQMHICPNNKCIKGIKICDGVNDCLDRSDEKGCVPEILGYSMRLTGSEQPFEGRVEVEVFGKRGYVCDDKFGMRDANVVCQELGYPMGALEVRGNSFYAEDLNDTFYLMDDVTCLGNESSLRDCDFNGWGVHNCEPQEIVGVVCKTPQENCKQDEWKCQSDQECIPLAFMCDGVQDCTDQSDEDEELCKARIQVRLTGGSIKEGRVEIRYHGIWGTVCDDDFNEDAAKVVCNQLGHTGSAHVKKAAYFGQGRGPIWLDQVYCQGNEMALDDCYHWEWGENNCDHGEDVGVVCGVPTEPVQASERSSKVNEVTPTFFPETCGQRNLEYLNETDIHFRVVKGSIAPRGHYPWQASLRVKGRSKPTHWCGAVIIAQRFLLTAAHCLSGFPKGAYTIVAGDYNVDLPEGTEQEVYVDEYYIHEKFRSEHRMNNDIALIKLKGEGLVFTKDVQPICLPDPDVDYQNEFNCTISGFGSIESGKSAASRELRAGWVPLQPTEVCKMPHVYGDAITNGMFCAGSLDEGVDACDGDSGGPLACLDKGLFTLYGLTSWGQHCGHANKPGVYVKVAYYREWIDSKMKQR